MVDLTTARTPDVIATEQGRRLAEERKRLGLGQSAAARLAGVGQPDLSLIESGRRPASLERLHQIAAGIGADPAAVDPRLACGVETLTLVPSAEGTLSAEGPEDVDLLNRLIPGSAVVPSKVDRLIQSAALAGVRLVIRTDLAGPPAPRLV